MSGAAAAAIDCPHHAAAQSLPPLVCLPCRLVPDTVADLPAADGEALGTCQNATGTWVVMRLRLEPSDPVLADDQTQAQVVSAAAQATCRSVCSNAAALGCAACRGGG